MQITIFTHVMHARAIMLSHSLACDLPSSQAEVDGGDVVGILVGNRPVDGVDQVRPLPSAITPKHVQADELHTRSNTCTTQPHTQPQKGVVQLVAEVAGA